MPKGCQIVRHVGRLLQEEEKKALMLQGNIFQETSLQTVKFADILQRKAVSSQQIAKKYSTPAKGSMGAGSSNCIFHGNGTKLELIVTP